MAAPKPLSQAEIDRRVNAQVAEALAQLRREPQLRVVKFNQNLDVKHDEIVTTIPRHSLTTITTDATDAPAARYKMKTPKASLPSTAGTVADYPLPPADKDHHLQRLHMIARFRVESEQLLQSLFTGADRMRELKHAVAANERFGTSIPACGADVLRSQQNNGGHSFYGKEKVAVRGGFEALKDVVEVRAARNARIDDLFLEHQVLVEEMVGRQRLEAADLALEQGMELGKLVESLEVDWPFEEAWAQARKKAMA